METKGRRKVPLHPNAMNSEVVPAQPMHSLPSHYSGALASDKFFSQKEVNSKPAKRINATLSKKTGPAIKKDKWGADFDELESMRSSTSSFYNNEAALPQEQIKKIQYRPFSGKFRDPKIQEVSYEEVSEEPDYNTLDRDALK
jgi:hypothetical protein